MLKLSNNGSRTQPSGFNSHPPDERRLLHIRNEILRVKPNAKFPDGSEKSVPQRSDERKTVPVTVKRREEQNRRLRYQCKTRANEKAAAKKSAEEKKLMFGNKGLVQIYTGNGKGKTTTALGLAPAGIGAGREGHHHPVYERAGNTR